MLLESSGCAAIHPEKDAEQDACQCSGWKHSVDG
jgi:hypothetical protein